MSINKSDDIRFMRLAIEQARLSNIEQRDDVKHPPAVGVILVDRKGKVLAQAYRSERIYDAHAEYVALALKLRNSRVPGAKLYTTLEPCIHVRSHGKIDCARRIVDSGISEVIMGMLDPDPRICGRGWLYLKQNGVSVRLSLLPIREEIENLNLPFIEKASVGTQAMQIQRSLIKTKKGRRRTPLGFMNEITPDHADIKSLIDEYRRRQIIPHVLWSSVNDTLWRNALKERTRILENLRIGVQSSYFPELIGDKFEFADQRIRYAWKVRTGAAKRIPKMWRGMKRQWGGYNQFAFERALIGFLKVCNALVLFTLTQLERKGKRAIFPTARRWIELVGVKHHSLSDIYRDIFGCEEPFYVATLSQVGKCVLSPDLEVYAPMTQIIRAWKEAGANRVINSVPLLYTKYVIPQVEYNLIGQSKVIDYGPMKWRRILDDRFNEF